MEPNEVTKQSQVDLETVFSKYQKLDVLRAQFDLVTVEHDVPEQREFLTEILVHMSIHRQASPETLVGILAPRFGTNQQVADGIWVAAELDYIDYIPTRDVFAVKYDIDPEVQEQIDLYQYPLPMVTPPKVVTDNYTNGYETIPGMVVLNDDGSMGKNDLCLDHLNRMNQIPLTLNVELANSAEGNYKKPKRKFEETHVMFVKRCKQAHTFFQKSMQIMEGLMTMTKTIYVTYKYDRRGRVYACGYHVNPQGPDFYKAVVEFADKELIE